MFCELLIIFGFRIHFLNYFKYFESLTDAISDNLKHISNNAYFLTNSNLLNSDAIQSNVIEATNNIITKQSQMLPFLTSYLNENSIFKEPYKIQQSNNLNLIFGMEAIQNSTIVQSDLANDITRRSSKKKFILKIHLECTRMFIHSVA